MKHHASIGAMYTLLSALIYTLLTVIVKRYTNDISTPVLLFVQMTAACICVSLLVIQRGKPAITAIYTSQNKSTHLWRTLFSLGIGYLLFHALKSIPLVNGVLLMNTAPLMVPFLGLLFFGKKIYHKTWPAIIIGFVGVGLVLNPRANGFNIDALYALGSGVCMAIGALFVRQAIEKGEDTLTTTFYYLFLGMVISGIISIPFWHHIETIVYLMIALGGVCMFLVQITYSLAFKYVEASFVTTLYYSLQYLAW